MCGIAGLFHFNKQPVNRELLAKMEACLLHRGPDGRGSFVSDNIALLHTRLKIIDLSDEANQPMSLNSGGLTLVYNGEIYNYLELRDTLRKMGITFQTESDTEVLLKSYREWGIDCLQHFNGMFAFAIWDDRKKRLFCARDRFGVKPFYYYHHPRLLAFASEIKPLLLLLSTNPRPNHQVISDYLISGLVEHSGETFFQDIVKLPAGHFLVADEEGIRIQPYWDFEVSERIEPDGSLCQASRDLRELFVDAVRLRLRSDVEVGSCFSGGLDSSAIVCTVDTLTHARTSSAGPPPHTYTAVFDVPRLDERPYVNLLAASVGMRQHWVKPKSEGFLQDLEKLIWFQEEPFASPSIYVQWCVFRTIGETGLKVVLDGQGADEQLCGYRKFAFFFLRELLKKGFYKDAFIENIHFLKTLSYFQDVDWRHSLRYLPFGPYRKTLKAMLFPESKKLFESHASEMGYQGSLAQRIKLDMTRFSLPALLRYEDKNSMAFSVESRTPYLDFRLVELIASLPLNFKIHKGWTKYILRRAMQDILPPGICWRKRKLAFDSPQDEWLKNELRPDIEKKFAKEGILFYYLKQDILQEEFHRYAAGKSWLPGNFFFRAYLLQAWADMFSMN